MSRDRVAVQLEVMTGGRVLYRSYYTDLQQKRFVTGDAETVQQVAIEEVRTWRRWLASQEQTYE